MPIKTEKGINIPLTIEKPVTTQDLSRHKVVILSPHFSEQIYFRSALSIMGQLRFAQNIIVPESQSRSLAEIRNDLVRHALNTDATHFLWLDGDELFPNHLTPQLLKHNKDIVGGWTVIRQEHIPNVYKMVSEYKHEPYMGEGVEKVDRLGFGSVLIKREVFERLPEPWFYFDEHHTTKIYTFAIKQEKTDMRFSSTSHFVAVIFL